MASNPVQMAATGEHKFTGERRKPYEECNRWRSPLIRLARTRVRIMTFERWPLRHQIGNRAGQSRKRRSRLRRWIRSA
jgi:hypothetical protein